MYSIETSKKNASTQDQEAGIVLPALLWWMGVPLSLLLVLWLIGVV